MVVGNWKMNGTRHQVKELINNITSNVGNSLVEVVVAPPSIFIDQVAELTKVTSVKLAAQNCSHECKGAYTGEVSPIMLQEFGCKYVILGHSERRQLFAERDELIAKKVKAAYDAGVTPILCVGETMAERDNQQTLQVIDRQLDAVIAVTGLEIFTQAIIAYEPVWAIGTGLSATPAQAEAVHSYIREKIAVQNMTIAESLKILYGGSVNAKNAAELFSQPNIDGGLIGGASLQAEEFVAICCYAENRVK